MHSARSAVSAQLPAHLLAGLTGLTQALADLGIAVHYTSDIDVDDAGELDEETRVVWVNPEASHAEQVWLLQQVWNWRVIGPGACPAARVVPRLQLVLPLPLPHPRSPHESAS